MSKNQFSTADYYYWLLIICINILLFNKIIKIVIYLFWPRKYFIDINLGKIPNIYTIIHSNNFCYIVFI